MKYPTLSEMSTSREWLDTFLGYNHNLRISSGEFYEMKNLTGDEYPVLSPRQKRGTVATTGNPRGITSKDKLCYVDGGLLYIDGVAVEGFSLNDEEKTFVSMGAYLIILPDKKYVNTSDTADCGSIEASYTADEDVRFELSTADGGEISDATTADVAPEDPENGDCWIDTSGDIHTLKQYSSASGEWVSITNTYIKISSGTIGAHFNEGDGISISGVADASLEDLNGSHIIVSRDTGYIVVSGIITQGKTQSEPITVRRSMPVMDFITESENRLWGCRWGDDGEGNTVNAIYACKLGDFKNWNVFEGLSSDSYAVTVGTDGAFTAAATYLGYPTFFKEGCLHKIYGNYPSNYQVQTVACRGVERGSERSLATVNEVLYYKSREAICAYDGSLPTEISYALGAVKYGEAVAGALGNKYYVSMKERATGEWSMMVYDTSMRFWHREDDTRAVMFCNHDGDLYYIDYADRYIKSVKGNGVPEGSISWSATTGILGTDSPDKKYISRLDVRMTLEPGASVAFFIEYNSSGEWEHIHTMTGQTLRSFAVPISPRRCDHLRLKIVGAGEAKIFSICKTTEQGSDI